MSEAALQMSAMDELEELSCVLIPTQPVQLLLPNVCVAEIVPWRRIKPMPKEKAGHGCWMVTVGTKSMGRIGCTRKGQKAM